MKKILFLFSLVLCSIVGYSQFVNTQTIGSNTTLLKSKGGLASDSAFILLNNYADTTAANFSVASKYAGSFIRVDTSIYYRTLNPNKWNLFAKVGSTGTIVSIGQGYGIVNSPNPITTVGTITTDTTVIVSKSYFSNFNALNLKYSDTASMLTPYLRKNDTTSMLSNYYNKTASDGRFVPLTRQINTNAPLAGGGSLSSNLTLSADTGRANAQLTTGGSLNKVKDSLVALIASSGGGTVLNVSTNDGFGINSSVTDPTANPIINIAVDTIQIATRYTTDSIAALKLNISDTSAMLGNYLRKTDTLTMLSPYLRKTDTLTMLSPYLRKTDTLTMLAPYLRKTDTLTMLAPYLRKTDTATMLSGYTRVNRFLDTTSVLRGLINTKGTGTVTSVGLSMPAIFSVSGSPVTSSGTLTATLANQNANLVFASPTTGSPAQPTFRSLVAADLTASTLQTVTDNGNTTTNSLTALGYNSSFLTVNAKMESSSNSGNFGTTTIHDVVLLTANTERIRLFTSGNTAMGSSGTNLDKGYTLQINGTIYDSIVPKKNLPSDSILVLNNGIISYRTPSEIRSDIGANASISSTGILWGNGTTVLGSGYTFLNDSTITYRGFKFLHQDITSQNPSGADWSLFLGYRAGESFLNGTEGYANTGIGRGALLSLQSNVSSEASSNTALGHNAGRFLTNTTGATLLGTGAGDALTTNATSEAVSGVGWHVFNQAANAYRSTSVGTSSSYSMNSTLPSAIVGFRGGFSITSGGHTSAVGANVFENRTTGVRGTAMGASAGLNSNGNDVILIGAFSDNNGSGSNNINIGSYTVNSTPGSSNEINIGNVILGKGVTTDSAQNTSSQLGIGVNRASGIDASAILDLTSTNKGFLLPRMTEAQRAAISSPANGLQVYTTGTNKLKYYNSSTWSTVLDSATADGRYLKLSDTATAFQTLTLDRVVANGGTTGRNIITGSVGVNGADIGLTGINLANQSYLAWYVSGTSGSQNVAIRGNGNNLELSSDGGLALTLGSGQSVTASGTFGINGVSDNVKGGTYTPTVTANTNVSSTTAYPCQYMRVGNVVTVSGQVQFAATVGSSTASIDVTLPIGSNFSNAYEGAGSGATGTTANPSLIIYAKSGDNKVVMSSTTGSTSNLSYFFSFTYQIL